ncbi:FtsX-like permease family protein [Microbacterium sp. JB110]|uniref:FtsX-like permease family protein n=1 Tax=Microbacterium sp. JB110 TaxID=2024477 RepID=UPI00097EEAE9|nr:FtsX-like permease family protein [Microbacterium sp. JB110]RCS59073.1 hypothetical protein CIK77_13060 [Microbacterium sp. JB110]SJM68620.1 putative ABC transporter integral membrane protein [Frigoribacterium sp. JB110]
MAVTLEAPARTASGAGEPPEHRSRFARWRAAARLAARQVRRDWRTSALVALLVALPLAAASAAAVYADSQMPTAEEEAIVSVGGTETWLRIVGGADPSRQQYLDDPDWVEYDTTDDGSRVHDEGERPDSPEPFVPQDTELLTLTSTSVRAETAGGEAHLPAVIGDIGDHRLDGRLDVVSGTRPLGPNEAAVSPAALDRLGADVGDVLRLHDPDVTLTIAAVMREAQDADEVVRLFLPHNPALAAGLDASPAATTWFAAEWAPTADEVYDLNAEGVIAYVPALAADPGDGASPAFDTSSLSGLVFAGMTAAVMAFSAYLIILLAGAALAVSARRQQRQLAMAAGVGATRSDVFRIVLLQGTVLGLLGGIIGTGAGIGVGAWLVAATADGSSTHPWGLHIPWLALAAVAAFAVVVGTLAALAPARSASRQNVIGALRGARRPVALRTDRPKWGSLLILVGIALTLAGAGFVMWVTAEPWSQWTSLLIFAGMAGVIAGPLVLQVGVILAGHWLLTVLARLLSRVSLGARLAARDAAAAPSRVVPAFGAIAACAFAASVVLGLVGATGEQSARNWYYQAPVGSVGMWVSTYDYETFEVFPDAAEAEEEAMAALDATSPASVGVIRATLDVRSGGPGLQADAEVISPELQRYVSCADLADGDAGWDLCQSPLGAKLGEVAGSGARSQINVVAADELATVTGTAIPDAAMAGYADGAAIVTDEAWLSEADDELIINTWTYGQFERSDPDASPEPVAATALPGIAIDAGPMQMGREIFVAPDTAEELGLMATFQGAVAAYDDPPSQEVQDRLTEQLSSIALQFPDGTDSAGATLESGPEETATWLWLVLAGTAVLVVGASAVALGLSRVERRSDDATLAAVGGAPRLRRSVTFWQGLIITGSGCLTGAVTGILPVLGSVMISSRSGIDLSMADVPWFFLAVLGVGLPLALAAASWLVTPRRSDLSRRTAIS